MIILSIINTVLILAMLVVIRKLISNDRKTLRLFNSQLHINDGHNDILDLIMQRDNVQDDRLALLYEQITDIHKGIDDICRELKKGD